MKIKRILVIFKYGRCSISTFTLINHYTMTIKSIFSDINIPRSTLFDLVLPNELDYNDQIALIDAVTNESLSFSQLRTSSLKLGYGLRKNFNLDKKDTVLIISPNSIHYPILFFGASSTGARVTLANPA